MDAVEVAYDLHDLDKMRSWEDRKKKNILEKMKKTT